MEWDAIWKRARSDLIVTTDQGDDDVFLWEHSSRVARVAQHLAGIDEVRAQDPDEGAIVAAALYHDAVWAIRVRSGEIRRTDILLLPLNDAAAEQSAALVEDRLKDLLPPASLERAARAVRLMQEREPQSIEAQIVAEANNLEEFGLLSLWPSIRRGMHEGKGIQAVIDSWRRKKEYHFWSARLRDSFRFESVRALAASRLESLEHFMEELDRQFTSADIPGLSTAKQR